MGGRSEVRAGVERWTRNRLSLWEDSEVESNWWNLETEGRSLQQEQIE